MALTFKIFTTITYFGSGMCFLMAVEQLTGKKRTRTNYLSAILLCCNSIILLSAALLANDVPLQSTTLVVFPFITAIYLIGPIDYMYFVSLVNPGFQMSFKMKIQLIPAFVVFLAEVRQHLQGEEVTHKLLEAVLQDPFSHWITLVVLFGAMMASYYLVYLLINVLSLRGEKKVQEGLFVVILVNGLAIIAALLMITGLLFSFKYILISGGCLLTFIQIIIFLAHSRNPEFFEMLKLEMRNKRYTKSIIKNLNTDLINERLLQLMGEEQLQREFDIDLKTIAARLSITPHQLSQFVNENYNLSFPNFINSFRIAEAKTLLLENPEQSVISICFHVGFSSKSSFNSAFRKVTGQSPLEFRKQGII